MATAMVTLRWCDKHLTEKDEEVPADPMPAWADGWQVDLCTECAGPIIAARELTETYGAKGERTPQMVKRPKVRPDQASYPCPAEGCGSVLSNRSSLGAHARQKHGVTIGELEGRELTHTCPDCGQGFTTPQGVAVHARKHQKSGAAA